MNPSQPKFEAIPAMPETRVETPGDGANFEAPKAAPERPASQAAPIVAAPAMGGPAAGAAAKDETTRAVEAVLEEGLRDVYAKLPVHRRAKFRTEGERVTREIAAMLKSLRVQADRVLNLIRKWLALIPGVNAFFLVQEAKIKTDKIMALAEEEKAGRNAAV